MVGGQAIDLKAAMPGAAPLDAAGAARDARAQDRRPHPRLRARRRDHGGRIACRRIRDRRGTGTALGLAFQIVDDILDVEGASADLGKTAGKDAAAGKPTYPSLFGLDESRRLAAECAERARAALGAARLGGQLPAIVGWVIARTS